MTHYTIANQYLKVITGCLFKVITMMRLLHQASKNTKIYSVSQMFDQLKTLIIAPENEKK